jgi:hypothetical protein
MKLIMMFRSGGFDDGVEIPGVSMRRRLKDIWVSCPRRRTSRTRAASSDSTVFRGVSLYAGVGTFRCGKSLETEAPSHHDKRVPSAHIWRRRAGVDCNRVRPSLCQRCATGTDRRNSTSATRIKLCLDRRPLPLERLSICLGARSLCAPTKLRAGVGTRPLDARSAWEVALARGPLAKRLARNRQQDETAETPSRLRFCSRNPYYGVCSVFAPKSHLRPRRDQSVGSGAALPVEPLRRRQLRIVLHL